MSKVALLNNRSFVGRAHTCRICGRVGPWGPGWEWYGSLADIEDGVPVVKVCSPECKRKHLEGGDGK